MIENSQYAYAAALRAELRHPLRWLDLGCGHQFLPAWMNGAAALSRTKGVRVVGIDRDRDAIRAHADLDLRIVGDIEHLPFASSSFDLVTANMVIEHVSAPRKLFGEVARVLAPAGTFLVHTPNLHGYSTRLAQCVPAPLRPRLARIVQGRREHDVYPTHYRGNTPEALRAMARAVGLEVVMLETVLSSPQLFRVPALGWLESRFLRTLAHARCERWRPCLLARFLKPATGDRRDVSVA